MNPNYMTSDNLFEIVERTTINNSDDQSHFNPQNRVIPEDPCAIADFKPRTEAGQIVALELDETKLSAEQKDAQDLIRAIAARRSSEVLSRAALLAQFNAATPNYHFPRDPHIELDADERNEDTSIVDFHKQILIQLITLRQAIIEANNRNQPILKPFTLDGTDFEITEDDMNHFRTIILNYLNSRSQADLDEAVLYVNGFRTQPDPVAVHSPDGSEHVVEDLEINEYEGPHGEQRGGMLSIKKGCLKSLEMHNITEVPHLTAGHIDMPEVALSQQQIDNLKQQIEAQAHAAGEAANTAEQDADVANAFEQNTLVQQARELAAALGAQHPNVITVNPGNNQFLTLNGVEDHINTARDAANGNGDPARRDGHDRPFASRSFANIADENVTAANNVPWNAAAGAELNRLLQLNTEHADNARGALEIVQEEMAAANQALEQGRAALRQQIMEEAQAASNQADRAIRNATAADALVTEAEILQRINAAVGPEVNDVRQAVENAHQHSNDASNPDSADVQAQHALDTAHDASDAGRVATTKELLDHVEATRNFIRGVQHAEEDTNAEIARANQALEAARQRVREYVAEHPAATDARADVNAYDTVNIPAYDTTMLGRVAQIRGLLDDFIRINPAMQDEAGPVQDLLNEIEAQMTDENRVDTAAHHAREAEQQMNAARAVNITGHADAQTVLDHLNTAIQSGHQTNAAANAAYDDLEHAETLLQQIRVAVAQGLANMDDAPLNGAEPRDDQLAIRAEAAANAAQANGEEADGLVQGITPELFELYRSIPEANRALEDLIEHDEGVWNHANGAENPNNARNQANLVRQLVDEARALDLDNDQQVHQIAERMEQARAAFNTAITSRDQSGTELEEARRAQARLHASIDPNELVRLAEEAQRQADQAHARIVELMNECVQYQPEVHEVEPWQEAERQRQIADEQANIATDRANDAHEARTNNDVAGIQGARAAAETARDRAIEARDNVQAISNRIVENGQERQRLENTRLENARRAAADTRARAAGGSGVGSGVGLGSSSTSSKADKKSLDGLERLFEARRTRGMMVKKG